METRPDPTAEAAARLTRHGILSVSGQDARAFLHGQLTNDIEHLPLQRAAIAGWCSAKGRLLASFLVIPRADGLLLQLARDLAAPVAKRLSMFVLRSKVTIANASDAWAQYGVWGAGAAERLSAAGLAVSEHILGVAGDEQATTVRIDRERILVLVSAERAAALEQRLGLPWADEAAWTLQEIRAGRALITAATQDLFVPQMVDLDRLGGVDFHKGCYPGQEIVARTQYRGQLKRRIAHARLPAHVEARPGQDVYADDLPGQASGTVVDVAAGELLAVLPIGFSSASRFRLAPDGPPLEILSNR